MAKTDTLHIRIEPSVKARAEQTLNDLGLSITEAVNVFLNQVILHNGIPFKIEKPKYNKETIQLIAAEKPLSPKYKEHYLTGNYKRFSRVSYTT